MIPIDPYERVFIFTLVPIHFLCLFIAILFLLLVIIRADNGIIKRSFIIVHSLIMIWLIGKIIKTVAPNLPIRWSANVFYYLGVIPLGPSLFIFSRAIIGKETNRKFLYYIPSAFFIIVLLTNPLHDLFYSKYNFLKDSFGPLFYCHFLITYIFSLLAIVNLIYGAIKYKDRKRSAISLFIGTILPLFVNIEYIFDIINPMFDITPIVYSLSLVIMGYAAFNYDFFKFIPGAVSKSLNSLPGAIVVNNKIYGQNHEDIKSVSKVTMYDININDEILSIKRFISIEDIKKTTNKLEKILIKTNQKNKDLKREANLRAKKLIEKERIKLAGEIHDILGYSISSIISILEICRFKKLKGQLYRDKINNILSIANCGISELKKTFNNKDDSLWRYKFYTLLSEVEIHNLELETIIDDSKRYSDNLYMLFYKVLKESLTNCLKYSKATKLQVTLSFLTNRVLFNIIDNGIGTSNIIKGTGLNNMELRVKEISGDINFYSDVNSGFFISISVPLEDTYLEENSEKNTLSKLAR